MLLASRSIATSVVASVLVLGGCGSSTDADPKSAAADETRAPSRAPTPDAEAELRKAVQAYSDGFLTGDTDTYDLFSKRCKDRTNRNEFIGMLMAAKGAYGSVLPFDTFKAQISGDLARVSYTYPDSAINQRSEPWVRESGSWRQDDC